MSASTAVWYVLAGLAIWSAARALHGALIARRSRTWKLAVTVAGLGLGTAPTLDGRPGGYALVTAGGGGRAAAFEAWESAVVRRRVRYLDGEPYNINDSYFPLTLAQGTEIMQPGDIARGANQVLAEQGYEQVRAFDEVYVRMPSPEEADRLELGPGTPVARHICTGTTADGMPVRVVLNILPGDRHVIVYERAKPYDNDPDPDDPEG